MDKKVIENFQRKNGNNNFTLKEMQIYHIAVFNDFKKETKETLNSIDRKLDKKVSFSIFKYVIGGITCFGTFIFGYLINEIQMIKHFIFG